MCKVGIGAQSPSHKLDISGNTSEFRIKDVKVNKLNIFFFSIIRWYCNLINITVTFTNRKDGVNPSNTLFIYGNGNVGIGC